MQGDSAEASPSLTKSVASGHEANTVRYWASEIHNLEHQMSVVVLRYNEFKAELAFARGRHRQTARMRLIMQTKRRYKSKKSYMKKTF